MTLADYAICWALTVVLLWGAAGWALVVQFAWRAWKRRDRSKRVAARARVVRR